MKIKSADPSKPRGQILLLLKETGDWTPRATIVNSVARNRNVPKSKDDRPLKAGIYPLLDALEKEGYIESHGTLYRLAPDVKIISEKRYKIQEI